MTRGRPFQPGNRFGRGRPPGSRNKAGQAAQATRQLLEQYAEPLIRKCILDALKGDKQAMRMCLERLIPLCRERLLQMPAPRIGTARQLAHAVEKVWKSMGQRAWMTSLTRRRRASSLTLTPSASVITTG